ncbi:MAG: hypothetical protein CSA39_05010 [Flavobacteriales bacterium]|nr:MAG: hypothetical protein CR989_05080 [Flavobacteriales bacterium]PIE48981.1 MAG: hypothetical protein CSA39_05010 [Flavobacteriales bacterium]
MKLIEKTGRMYIWLSVIIFVFAAIALIFVLTAVMDNRLDEQLFYNKEVVAKKIKYDFPLTIFEEPEELNPSENRLYPNDTIIYKDTLIFRAIKGEGDDEFEKYRQLTAYETLHGKRYKIVTRNSLVRNQDFIWVIVLNTFIIIGLLLAGLFIVNTQISKKLWQPFYTNLGNLKDFSIQDQERIALEPSDIDEFKELNSSIKNLTQKLQSDYNTLKQFSENASHEMQTPLAVMLSKIELLLQSNKLDAEQSTQLQAIYKAGKKLSKLNKTLLLLAKVENQQYSKTSIISIKEIVEKQVENFEDFIESKNLKIKTKLSDDTIEANTLLTETLLSNLLSNAIKHNVPDGYIQICYTKRTLLFENTGNPLNIRPKELFDRFKKDSTRKDSLGLGLAIVKQICDVNNWQLSYTCRKNIHKIVVIFNSDEFL